MFNPLRRIDAPAETLLPVGKTMSHPLEKSPGKGRPAKGAIASYPQPLCLRNAESARLSTLPYADLAAFTDWLMHGTKEGQRLICLFALPEEDASHRLIAALADDRKGVLYSMSTELSGPYPSLAARLPQAHLFERILHEELGLVPEGHPWLKPARFSHTDGPHVGDMEFYQVEGEEVHEVGVGPVHAGVIEAGHFRFQCLGEEVLHLEISLGYHHRGVDALLREAGTPLSPRMLPLMEVVAGDSTIAHAWAFCSLYETFTDTFASPQGQVLRSLALELERLANHTGDLGAISGDAGFFPVPSYCGRLRGDWLNATAVLCGNRFGRGFVRPGGCGFSVDKRLVDELKKRIADTARDVQGATRLLWHSNSFLARISDIGGLERADAEAVGLVGVAARACGLPRDVRRTHPLPGVPIPPSIPLQALGDVHARAYQRQQEIAESVSYCQRILETFLHSPDGEACKPVKGPMKENRIAFALVEGWRGEVCHAAVTGAGNTFKHYSIVDPSVHNWIGLALVLRGQQISDFPLCNKSFNLSYCGHDL